MLYCVTKNVTAVIGIFEKNSKMLLSYLKLQNARKTFQRRSFPSLGELVQRRRYSEYASGWTKEGLWFWCRQFRPMYSDRLCIREYQRRFDRAVRQTTDLPLLSKSRMSGRVPAVSHTPSWCIQRQFYLYYTLACVHLSTEDASGHSTPCGDVGAKFLLSKCRRTPSVNLSASGDSSSFECCKIDVLE